MNEYLDRILERYPGALNLEKYEDNFLLPRILLAVLLKKETHAVINLPSEWQREAGRIYRVLP